MKKIDEDKKYYKVVEQRATDTNRLLDSFQAPGIPDGIYSSDVLYEWQNVGFKEISHRTGIPLQHDDICICDQCLNDMDIQPKQLNNGH